VLVAVSVVLLLAIGYAMWPKSVPPPPQPTAAELDDRRILQEVNRVLDSSSAVRKHDIGVRVENGVVILNGQVGTKEESDIAENLTYSVVGVNGIKNNLLVGEAIRRSTSKQETTAKPTLAQSQAPQTQPTDNHADAATQQHRIDRLLAEAQGSAEKGEYSVARDLYVAVLAIDPNNEKALEGRRYTRRMLMQQRRAR